VGAEEPGDVYGFNRVEFATRHPEAVRLVEVDHLFLPRLDRILHHDGVVEFHGVYLVPIVLGYLAVEEVSMCSVGCRKILDFCQGVCGFVFRS
jgi:hypothetical protein